MSGERDAGEPRDHTLVPQGAPPPPAARAVAGRGSDEIGDGRTVILPGVASARMPEIPGVVITAEIGRGGMGIVYRGNQSYLDREVAVKLLGDQHRGGDFEARFRREAKILAGITHPNIVACYQAGLTQDGKAYLVMEYIDGPNLQECLEQNGCLAPELALAICRDMAQALAHAYEAGIIHRDVKPANVLLQKKERAKLGDPFPYRPKLADLGLARYEGKATTRVDLTIKGAVMGSPPTMAPEQFDDPDSVDFRTDIYGLGCVLFHALTGKLAFAQTSLTALIAKKMEPVGPDPRKHRPELSTPVAELCMKMLACQRDSRPSSYAELTDRLNALLPPVQPRTTDVAFEAARKNALEKRRGELGTMDGSLLRRRKSIIVGAIAVGVLVIGAAAYMLRDKGDHDDKSLAQNPPPLSTGDTDRTKQGDSKVVGDRTDGAPAGHDAGDPSGPSPRTNGPDANEAHVKAKDDAVTPGDGGDRETQTPGGVPAAVEPKSYLRLVPDVSGADERVVKLSAQCVETPPDIQPVHLFAGGYVVLPTHVENRKQHNVELEWSLPRDDKGLIATLEPGVAGEKTLKSKRSKANGDIELQVRARGGDGSELTSGTSSVHFVFVGHNTLPVASIKSKIGRPNFAIDHPIQLSADVSDADGDNVRVEWTLVDAKGVRKANLENEHSTELSWKAPRTQDGDFEHLRFQLLLNDGLEVAKSDPIDVWCNVDEQHPSLTPDDKRRLFKSTGSPRSAKKPIGTVLEDWEGSLNSFTPNYGIPIGDRLIGPRSAGTGKCGEVRYTLPPQGSWKFEGVSQLYAVNDAEAVEPGVRILFEYGDGKAVGLRLRAVAGEDTQSDFVVEFLPYEPKPESTGGDQGAQTSCSWRPATDPAVPLADLGLFHAKTNDEARIEVVWKAPKLEVRCRADKSAESAAIVTSVVLATRPRMILLETEYASGAFRDFELRGIEPLPWE